MFQIIHLDYNQLYKGHFKEGVDIEIHQEFPGDFIESEVVSAIRGVKEWKKKFEEIQKMPIESEEQEQLYDTKFEKLIEEVITSYSTSIKHHSPTILNNILFSVINSDNLDQRVEENLKDFIEDHYGWENFVQVIIESM